MMIAHAIASVSRRLSQFQHSVLQIFHATAVSKQQQAS